MEIPSTDWSEGSGLGQYAPAEAPLKAEWRELPGIVRHTFTRFYLELRVLAVRVDSSEIPYSGVWYSIADLDRAGLPSVMTKIAQHALAHG